MSSNQVATTEAGSPTLDGVVYSRRRNHCPLSSFPIEAYARFLSGENLLRLQRITERLRGLKVLEINATAQGGGVAEMLHSSIPFMDELGIETEWITIKGNQEFFECTKKLHNLLQGMKEVFSLQMEKSYYNTLTEYCMDNPIDYQPDVVVIHDPQPLGLASFLRSSQATWLWRCHIDIEGQTFNQNPGLWSFMNKWVANYDAAIFSAAHYIVSRWPLSSFIIPPFIDPLSEKNRELSQMEIDNVLAKYEIDSRIPIIAQLGRFDPWKGLDRTIATYRLVRQEERCQLVLAGGMASDDPEGKRILSRIYEDTKNDDIHVLNLSMDDRLQNWLEVNALQRAASVIMQPSTKEGFGLVITEALWKSKPVIAGNVGGVPLQVRDGDTGYFYESPHKTAKKVINLLRNRRAAEAIGKRGQKYVQEHFLMPDRVADYLAMIDMTVNRSMNKIPTECIISFHPWYKQSKRR